MQQGSLLFIKTAVKELFDFMDFNISSDLKFKKLDNKDFIYSSSFINHRLCSIPNPYKTVLIT